MRTSLCLIALLLVLPAFAQVKVTKCSPPIQMANGLKNSPEIGQDDSKLQQKTSFVIPDRWYDYTEYYKLDAAIYGNFVMTQFLPIWNDTTATWDHIYGGLRHNTFVSAGEILQPWFSGFNSPDYYDTSGLMMMSPADAFEVDSIGIYGCYLFNTTKRNVVDTLRVSLVHGDGTAGADVFFGGFSGSLIRSQYGLSATDTLSYATAYFDSVNNTGAGSTLQSFIILLDSNSWGDTTALGVWYRKIQLPSTISAGASDLVAYTLSFKSGDTSFPSVSGSGSVDDSIASDYSFRASSYNVFRPLLNAKMSAYATYNFGDWNTGIYKRLPNFENGWENKFFPMFADSVLPYWAAASQLQHVQLSIHVACTTCHVGLRHGVSVSDPTAVSKLSINPNPARAHFDLNYELPMASDVEIILTSMFGREVASQKIKNVKSGKVSFDTKELPPGLYLCTVKTDTERLMGKVVVIR